MRVRFVYRGGAPADMLCSAELVFDEADGPLAGLWLIGFSLWRVGSDGVVVTLPHCPFGAPKEWRLLELMGGDRVATDRIKRSIARAWDTRGELWTCPGCHRMHPLASAPTDSEAVCDVCQVCEQPESAIHQQLARSETPPPVPPRPISGASSARRRTRRAQGPKRRQ